MRPREKRVVLLKPGLAKVCLSVWILSPVWPFIAPSHDSYTVAQGPIGSPEIIRSTAQVMSPRGGK
jgi:hypothetical protein